MPYEKGAKPVLPYGPEISTLIRAAVEWCFSLLFTQGASSPTSWTAKDFSRARKPILPAFAKISLQIVNGRTTRSEFEGDSASSNETCWQR